LQPVLRALDMDIIPYMGRDHLNCHFDNHDHEFLNKYHLWIDDDLNFIQYHYRLIVHQKLSNYNRCKLYKILIVLDEISNNNQIT
jgi:hypothetical protein